ncbi:MAG: MBL fold metallo-hydrolase [Lachnospiraceae bacterium]|nr:MBL fold metallo-hydrolase [Lachnospiraceae bacterium]
MSYEQIRVNTQSSIRIEGSKTVYFDPFRIPDETHDADVIFVTHSHYDHFEPESIAKVRKEDTIFIAPATMSEEILKLVGDSEFYLLSPEEDIVVGDLKITGVPAYNKLKPFHPKHNRWLGYLLEMDGTRYYVAGDTDAVKDLQKISCDVALIPIGGTYTMNAKDAAGLINAIKPAAVVPTHYGGIVGSPEDAEVFRSAVLPGTEVVLKLNF